RRSVSRLRRNFPFDLIHAHFAYPDGAVGAILARKYGVPLVITEQVPWLDEEGAVSSLQARWAVQQSSTVVAISRSVKRSIEDSIERFDRIRVIPDAVDGSIFRLPSNGGARGRGGILFVGAVRPMKGVDVLLRALRILVDEGTDARLSLIGGAYYGRYQQEHARLLELTEELGLGDRVEFQGRKSLAELVKAIQESSLLVLPSRSESLGMVLVEALACGTPVVATRCGGPEDIVTDDVGKLVQPDDAPALAQAMAEVLARSNSYDRHALRAHAIEAFGIESVSARYAEVYRDALAGAA